MLTRNEDTNIMNTYVGPKMVKNTKYQEDLLRAITSALDLDKKMETTLNNVMIPW